MAIGLIAAGSASHPTVEAARAPFVAVWEPYWAGTAGATRFAAHADVVNEISPFFLSATADGSVVSVSGAASMTAAINAARAKGVKVIPTVTDGAGKGGMAAIIADDSARANHIANLVATVMNGGYDGVDLDYEVFAFTDGRSTWPTTMPLWVQFVHQLSDALHAQGRMLIVTIPPVWEATTPGNAEQKNYWVYAQDQILPFVDRLRLMVYDWSPGTPSANAPIDKYVIPVVAYSTRVAAATGQPASKLILGVPAYGRHWRRSADGSPCPDGSLNTSTVTQVSAPGVAPGVDRRRDAASGELTFSWDEVVTGPRGASTITLPPYVQDPGTIDTVGAAGANTPAIRLGVPGSIVTCAVRHTVWYPDEWSVKAKADVAVQKGWGGVVIWAGGYEVDATYDVLAGL